MTQQYEQTGWNDDRISRAYDLIADVLKDMGEELFRHPLLAEIEQLDERAAPA